MAGQDSLAFDEPDRVNVRPTGIENTWAEVETKSLESLKVTLAGPREAIDLDRLPPMEVDGPFDVIDHPHVRVTLNLTSEKHVRSRKLQTFLRYHLKQTKGS